MSAATVVTRGFGSFGDVNFLPTRGFGDFGEGGDSPVDSIDLSNISECRTYHVRARNNTFKVRC